MVLSDEAIRFAAQFRDIVENEKYQELKRVPRHGFTNTYDHSVRVAYMSYLLAQKWNVDCISAARVGLLHDFCTVDYHLPEKEDRGEWYCFYHPKDAVENAKPYRLTETEKKAILCHMFPLAKHMPVNRLALILTLADKAVAIYEGCYGAAEFYERIRLFCYGVRVRIRRRTD